MGPSSQHQPRPAPAPGRNLMATNLRTSVRNGVARGAKPAAVTAVARRERGSALPADARTRAGEKSLSIFLNGSYITDRDKAVVPLYEHGLLYGDGVFEGIRAYNGRIFRMQDHMDRLYHSAKSVMLTIPYSKAELSEILLE